jgi:hypothetical protein
LGFRAVVFDGLLMLFLTFTMGLYAFIFFRVFGSFNILAFSIGALSGLLPGLAMGLTYTRNLEKTGEIRVSYQTLRFILLILGGVLLIFIGVLFLVLFSGVEARGQFLSFLFPVAPVLVLGRITVLLRWESKNKLRIIIGYDAFGFVRRIYTTSQIDKSEEIEVENKSNQLI